MLGPHPNSLGTIALDFFQHGGVAFAGGEQHEFATAEICLSGGFKTEQPVLAGWGGQLIATAGWDEEQPVSGGSPVCND